MKVCNPGNTKVFLSKLNTQWRIQGGALGHGPLLQKKNHHRKNRNTCFVHPCVSTNGQRKFAPLMKS